jgi:hypothetical protein
LPRVFVAVAVVGFAGEVFSREAVRLSLPAAAAVPRFVDSIISCMDAEIALVAADAADLSGETGLTGDVGRESVLFMGDIPPYDFTGDCGKVREL